METRKSMDCRDAPNTVGCTLKMSGREDEVLRAAVEHAISVHGEKDSQELRDFIKSHLKDEPGDRFPSHTGEINLDQRRQPGGPFATGQEDQRVMQERREGEKKAG